MRGVAVAELQLPLPQNMQEAMFFLAGVTEGLRAAIAALEVHAPDALEEAEQASVAAAKGIIGEDGTTIENEALGIGAAVKVIEVLYRGPKERLAGHGDDA